jgi:hypothetical protein
MDFVSSWKYMHASHARASFANFFSTSIAHLLANEAEQPDKWQPRDRTQTVANAPTNDARKK